ncbi:MAG: hypothetical protein SGPRY_013668 [Prymnesium sp.]
MMLTLSLIPVLFTREIYYHIQPTNLHPSQKVLMSVLVVGITLVALTGIFPARYATNPVQASSYDSVFRYKLYGDFHMLGVSVACLVVVFVSYGFFLYHRFAAKRAQLNVGLFARSCYVAAIVISLTLFLRNETTPDTLDYCSRLKTQGACDSWLRGAEECPGEPSISFLCGWKSFNFTQSQQILLPKEDLKLKGMCVRKECKLYSNAFSIMAEYAVLFLAVTYGITFSLADLQALDGQTMDKLARIARNSLKLFLGGGGRQIPAAQPFFLSCNRGHRIQRQLRAAAHCEDEAGMEIPGQPDSAGAIDHDLRHAVRGPKDPGQPRRKQESNFFITINSNKSSEPGEQFDTCVKHMSTMLTKPSMERAMASYLTFGPVDASYLDDKS